MARSRKPAPHIQSEWPYLLDIEDLTSTTLEVTFSANQDECRALSRRFAVEGLSHVTANLEVSPVQAGLIRITGSVTARVHQLCVVTQEPVDTDIEEPVEGCFAEEVKAVSFAKARKDRDMAKGHAEQEILNEVDDPEPVVNGQIDLGELAAQHLSLGIPAFPRRPGVVSPLTDEDLKQGKPLPGRKNPFEALKDWKIQVKGKPTDTDPT